MLQTKITRNLAAFKFRNSYQFLDVKAEVENTIKMGRKLVESTEVADDAQRKMLTEKIDSLKEEFNVTGKNVSEVQSNLESSLALMKKFDSISEALDSWTKSTVSELSSMEKKITNQDKFGNIVGDLYLDMHKHKRSFLDLYKIYEDVSSLITSETLVSELETRIGQLESQWHSMNDSLLCQRNKFNLVPHDDTKDKKEINIQLLSK